MTPNISGCIRKVTLIANCKRIHDYLHELRQNVIRPLREEVLSIWKQEGALSVRRERVIWACMSKASRQLGGIAEVRESIGPEHQGLRDSVDTVLQRRELWKVDPKFAGLPAKQRRVYRSVGRIYRQSSIRFQRC